MKYSRPLFIVFISFIYFAFYSMSVVRYETQLISSHLISDSLLIKSFIYGVESYERAFLLILSLTAHRLIFAIFLPLLFLFSSIAAYFINTFKIQITKRVIPTFFEATPHEIASFITTPLILWCVLSLLISFIFVWLFFRFDKQDLNTKRNNVFVFVAVIFTFCALVFSGHATNDQYMPYNYLKSTGNYILSKYYKIGRNDISLYPANFKGDDNLIVVMVIGESARSDHFSLNGYERDTNPNLSKIKNLINFKSATSCDNLTRFSVPCMLTRATHDNRTAANTETSFISIFRRLGFSTVWIDNQQVKDSFVYSNIADIIGEAEHIISPVEIKNYFTGDTIILPYLDELLNENKGKLLLVIHTFGSHWNYDRLYDEQHHRWDPVCKSSTTECDTDLFKFCDYQKQMTLCGRQALTNSYDNTILQTDYFISEVINKLKSRTSILLYSSDHGESLGEDGFFLHGQTDEDQLRPEQFRVPVMLWASDEFIKNNSNKFLNARNKSKQNISHDIIFHTLLNCAGIESQVIDKALSLCSD